MAIKSNGAGHGGKKVTSWMDPGAVNINGLREADVVRTITQKMQNIARVNDTTDGSATNVNQNLQNQVNLMNNAGAGFAITNHTNAFNTQASGAEVWYFAGNEAARVLAECISKAIADTLGIPNRGAKPTTSLFVHRNTNANVDVLLIEWFFIDNANDVQRFNANGDRAIEAVMKVLGYNVTVQPPTPTVPVLKIINLWDYTGKDWLPKIQRSYANVVSADRAFKVKTGSTWKVRLTHINYAQAVVICDQLRKVYPKYPVTGYRINVNDSINGSTPFAVEVANIPEADIENVLRHVQQTYAGIITADRIFLTPQNKDQVILEIHNFKESQRDTIKQQLKERYSIADKQFQ